MQVWVVIKLIDGGVIAGVFDTLEGASEYVTGSPYTAYCIEEREVQTKAKSHA